MLKPNCRKKGSLIARGLPRNLVTSSTVAMVDHGSSCKVVTMVMFAVIVLIAFTINLIWLVYSKPSSCKGFRVYG